MKRTLRLRRESLVELTPADLVDVRAGVATVGDHCGPLLNTALLSALGVTGCRFTEATCTW
jgi:hypothetical protein